MSGPLIHRNACPDVLTYHQTRWAAADRMLQIQIDVSACINVVGVVVIIVAAVCVVLDVVVVEVGL